MPRRLRGLPQQVARVAGLIGLLSVLGVGLSHWEHEEAELMRYRSALQELTNAVRAMRARAVSAHRTVRLEIDVPRRAFRVVSIPSATSTYGTLEQTIWLPAGLEVLEAPQAGLTVVPGGEGDPASLVFAAPAYNRIFRLRLDPHGRIVLHEERTI